MTGNDIAFRVAGRCALLLVVLSLGVSAQAQVTVTHVANAGFLLEGGGKKVLIDALFDEGISWYPRIPNETRKLLRDAAEPFDAVDLVLVTHMHEDHFGPRTLTRHMRSNPDATLLCTPQTLGVLERHIEKYPEVAERVVTLYPEEGDTVKGTYAGIDVQVLNLHHGRNRYRPIENLGFIIEIGGMNVLHVGDTEALAPVFERYEFKKQRIDLALLPSWFVSFEHWASVVDEYVHPSYIVAMHMPLADAPPNAFGPHMDYDRRFDAMKGFFPDVVLMDAPGAKRTFPPKESN